MKIQTTTTVECRYCGKSTVLTKDLTWHHTIADLDGTGFEALTGFDCRGHAVCGHNRQCRLAEAESGGVSCICADCRKTISTMLGAITAGLRAQRGG